MHSTFTDVVIRDVVVHRRNRRDYPGSNGLLDLSNNVHNFGILPTVYLGVVLNDSVFAIHTLNKVQTAR